jgi:hypothetical protein
LPDLRVGKRAPPQLPRSSLRDGSVDPTSRVSLELVTPEPTLAQVGGEISATVPQLLRDHHIRVHLATSPVRVHPTRLTLAPLAHLSVERVVCMPEARGVAIAGLPHNPDRFLPTDQLGQIPASAPNPLRSSAWQAEARADSRIRPLRAWYALRRTSAGPVSPDLLDPASSRRCGDVPGIVALGLIQHA